MADYEIIQYNNQRARQYPDGTIRNDENGQLMHIPTELARANRHARRNIANEVAGEAIMEATKSKSPEEGLKKIIAKRVEVAMTDKGRAGNDAAKLVIQQAGYSVEEKHVEEVIRKEFALDAETLEMLQKMMDARGEIITVEPRELTADERKGLGLDDGRDS